MSEPMSNHEIEDVLSSIRRLVSEDLRPTRGAEAGVPEAPAPQSGGKLLLTPALRVVDGPDGPVLAPAPAQAERPVEDVVARLGAAVAEEEWESPFGDPQIWPDEVVRTGPRIADPVPAFSRAGDVAAPEQARAEPVADAGAQAAVPPMQDDSSWADAAEAAVRADLAQEAEDEVITSLYAAEPGGMQFDEEVLRDLVRDLIREELSGTLGERITRNVRKLVRAEIARALALRDFE